MTGTRKSRVLVYMGLLVLGIVLLIVFLGAFWSALKQQAPAVRLYPSVALFHDRLPPAVEVELSNCLWMRFALIPSGHFFMGSPSSEPNRQDDELLHEVNITRPFYMAEAPVTREQYHAVMSIDPSIIATANDAPVEGVSWNDACEFCRALSTKSGRIVRLPTEAQWEYACRAGTTTPYNVGEKLSANLTVNGAGYPSTRHPPHALVPVSPEGFMPNAWGLYHMHGNVWEWCEDWYGQYPDAMATDPSGPADGRERVMRGGGFDSYPRDRRSARREKWEPGYKEFDVGFRPVLQP